MDQIKHIPFGGPDKKESSLEQSEIVVLPLCYEANPSYGEGSLNGPIDILVASEQLECMDEETLINWYQARIHTRPLFFPSLTPEKGVQEMKGQAEIILKQHKFLLCLGGDHAITIGPVMAAAELYPEMAVLQVDAHLDLRNQWNGSRLNHACVVRRIMEDVKAPVIQVGIRSFSEEEAIYVKEKGLTPFFAHQISETDDTWIDDVVNLLPEHVYMTIDLDGLDPSEIPGTGTPEPGGLRYRQLVKLVRAVGKNRKVIAADINELAKIEGTQVSEYTAAKIATKLMVYCVIGKKLLTLKPVRCERPNQIR